MNVWPAIAIAILLWSVAALMLNSHFRTWNDVQARASKIPPGELDFRYRQFRRRLKTSALLGLLGTVIVIGQWMLVVRLPPMVILLFWIGVAILALYVALLAVGDMIATRLFYSRIEQDQRAEGARLRAELHRVQKAKGQDASGPEDPESPDSPPEETAQE